MGRRVVELLIGCINNPEGWATRAIGAIRREAHPTTYYKLVKRANVSVTELTLRLLSLARLPGSYKHIALSSFRFEGWRPIVPNRANSIRITIIPGKWIKMLLRLLVVSVLALASPMHAETLPSEVRFAYAGGPRVWILGKIDGAFDQAFGARVKWIPFNSGADVLTLFAARAIDIARFGSSPVNWSVCLARPVAANQRSSTWWPVLTKPIGAKCCWMADPYTPRARNVGWCFSNRLCFRGCRYATT